MINKNYNIQIIIFLFISSISLHAQTKIIHGKVTTLNSITVENAHISVNKNKNLIYSDSLGFFSIECKLKDKVSIAAAGFKTKTIKIKSLVDSLNIDLTIKGDEEGIELATLKGHISKNNESLAIKLLNTKKPYYYGFTTMTELILGKFPTKVNIVNNELILRGRKSLGVENRDGALIIINGSDYRWSQVKDMVVTNIKSIRILSSLEASRYGSGAGNGVILIKLIDK